MIIVMSPSATKENLEKVVKKVESAGLRTHISEGEEVTIDELLGFLTWNIQSLSQPKDGDAVDDAEVGTLRLGTLVARYLFYSFLIDVGGGGRVQVLPLAEHPNHFLVVAEVSHHAQFNLTVVS